MCLSNSLDEFKQKVERIVVGYTFDKEPVTVKDLGCAGAVAMLMKEAIKPNLVQTLEGNPVFIHGGPFANIAHGCNSIVATQMARCYGDYVVTEAGFGADLGAEKFMDITSRYANFAPDCVVIVATIRALKMHGGLLKEELVNEDVPALKRGIANLEKHIENIKLFNVPYVIAINKFVSDTENEIKELRDWASAKGHEVSLADVWGKGGEGGQDLACKVVKQIDNNQGKQQFRFLYDLNLTIREKMDIIAKEIYGARLVEYSTKALTQIRNYERLGWDKLPICVAKTQYSLSDDPKLMGRPTDFFLNVREF